MKTQGAKAHLHAGGFSLMELMVSLAIVAILAAIALPSYNAYVLRNHRVGAQMVLAESVQTMERFYTANNTYVGAALPSLVSPANASPASARYNISFVQASTADSFSIQAVPSALQNGEPCGTLTITHTGAQSAAAGVSGCW